MSIDALAGSTKTQLERLGDAAGDLMQDRKQQADRMLDDAVGAIGQVYGRANETTLGAIKQASRGVREARGELQGFFADRPLVATGMAIGLGIALGALLIGGGKVAYDQRSAAS